MASSGTWAESRWFMGWLDHGWLWWLDYGWVVLGSSWLWALVEPGAMIGSWFLLTIHLWLDHGLGVALRIFQALVDGLVESEVTVFYDWMLISISVDHWFTGLWFDQLMSNLIWLSKLIIWSLIHIYDLDPRIANFWGWSLDASHCDSMIGSSPGLHQLLQPSPVSASAAPALDLRCPRPPQECPFLRPPCSLVPSRTRAMTWFSWAIWLNIVEQ